MLESYNDELSLKMLLKNIKKQKWVVYCKWIV